MAACCCRFFTAGLLFLTIAYIGFVLLIRWYAPKECINELCRSEGVDDTIMNWSSDFFVAFYCFLFALQLSLSKKEIRKSGILAHIFMGGSFILAGIGHLMYSNSGIDDDVGMLGYWIVWVGFSFFFTVSGLAMAHFALTTTKNVYLDRHNICCASHNPEERATCFPSKIIMITCETLLVLSLSGVLMGGIWCSLSPLNLQVTTVVDESEPTSNVSLCFTILYYSDMARNVTYAVLWLPVGLLLRAASLQWPETILGLPTQVAAWLAMVLQWSVGAMYPVYLSATVLIRGSEEETYLELWKRAYGFILYHWGMLLTLYCLHNLCLGLPKGCIGEEEPPMWSMEWLLWQLGFTPENDPDHPKMKRQLEKEDREEALKLKMQEKARKKRAIEEASIVSSCHKIKREDCGTYNDYNIHYNLDSEIYGSDSEKIEGDDENIEIEELSTMWSMEGFLWKMGFTPENNSDHPELEHDQVNEGNEQAPKHQEEENMEETTLQSQPSESSSVSSSQSEEKKQDETEYDDHNTQYSVVSEIYVESEEIQGIDEEISI